MNFLMRLCALNMQESLSKTQTENLRNNICNNDLFGDLLNELNNTSKK